MCIDAMVEVIEQLSVKNWLVRKSALEKIEKRISSKECSSSETSDLVFAVINALSKESHAYLVVEAANILTHAASTMKQHFTPFSKTALAACLNGFRGSKGIIVSALRSAADATLKTLTLDIVIETVFASFVKPHPNVQTEATNLLARALQQQTNKVNPLATRRNLFKRILSPLLPLFNARAPELRDAICQALGSARLFLADDRYYANLMKDVDDGKKERVAQAFNKLKEQQFAKAPSPLVTSLTSENQSSAISKVNNPNTEQGTTENSTAKVPRPTTAGGVRCKPPVTKQTTSNSESIRGTTASLTAEQHISNDEVSQTLCRFMSETVISQLKSNQWKDRLTALNFINKILSSLPLSSAAFVQSFARFLLEPPGLKDSNFQVKCRLLEVLGDLFGLSKQACLCESLLETLTWYISDLIGDSKNTSACVACLNGLKKATGGGPLIGETLLRLTLSVKSPKSAVELVRWLTMDIEEKEFRYNLKFAQNSIKAGFISRFGEVRQAFIKLAGAVYTSLALVCESSAASFRSDLESSCCHAICVQLVADFDVREAATKHALSATPPLQMEMIIDNNAGDDYHNEEEGLDPRKCVKRTASVTSSCCPSSKRINSGISHPSASSIHSQRVLDNSLDLDSGASPLGLSTTYCCVPSSLFPPGLDGKKKRLAKNPSRLSRSQLEGVLLQSEIHDNLLRNLTTWDQPQALKAGLHTLMDLLLQQTPSRHHVALSDGLADTHANIDLIFHWLVEGCFQGENNPIYSELIHTALEYLSECISRLADAKLALVKAEMAIILPYPLFSSKPMGPFIAASPDQAQKVSALFHSFCRVYPANFIFDHVMEAINTEVDIHLIRVLLQLVVFLMTRFSSMLNPTVSDVKALAQHIGSDDKEVHQAALDCFRVARNFINADQLRIMAGQLAEKDTVLLEEALTETNQSHPSTMDFHTPQKPQYSSNDEGPSYNNCPSILASISRSHIVQCSQMLDRDEEAAITSTRQWILDTVAMGSSQKQSEMVSFLVSSLLCQHPITSMAQVFSSIMALSHIDFLNQVSATRDLLLPKASMLIANLGIQLSLIGSNSVPRFQLTEEDVVTLIKVTCGCVVSLFRGGFLTREIISECLSHLLAGLIRLHSKLELICKAELQFDDSCMQAIVSQVSIISLKRGVEGTIDFIHNKLIANNIATYTESLLNLMNPSWDGFHPDECLKIFIPLNSSLHLVLFDQVVKKIINNPPSVFEMSKLLEAFVKLYPFDGDNELPVDLATTFAPGLEAVAMAVYRIHISGIHTNFEKLLL